MWCDWEDMLLLSEALVMIPTWNMDIYVMCTCTSFLYNSGYNDPGLLWLDVKDITQCHIIYIPSVHFLVLCAAHACGTGGVPQLTAWIQCALQKATRYTHTHIHTHTHTHTHTDTHTHKHCMYAHSAELTVEHGCIYILLGNCGNS